MFNDLKLTPKIAGAIAVTLLVTSTVGFFITRHRINQQAEDAFVDKAFRGTADDQPIDEREHSRNRMRNRT